MKDTLFRFSFELEIKIRQSFSVLFTITNYFVLVSHKFQLSTLSFVTTCEKSSDSKRIPIICIMKSKHKHTVSLLVNYSIYNSFHKSQSEILCC